MTEFINDPCEELEIEQPQSTEQGPSVPPASSSQLSLPEIAFPTRQSITTDQEIIRESSLIDTTLLLSSVKNSALKFPVEALEVNSWQNNLENVDPFRFVTSKLYEFTNGSLFFSNPNLKANESIGVPFDIKLESETSNQVENCSVQLIFDKAIFESAAQKAQRFQYTGDLGLFMFNYIEGLDFGSTPLVVSSEVKLDSSFTAPAAFFESEALQAQVPLVEVASMDVFTGPLDLRESTVDETTKPSAYRTYSFILNNEIPALVNEDNIQKFAAGAVSELKQINSLITQQGIESSVYDKMLPIINKHVKISMNTHHESSMCTFLEENKLDTILLDYLATNNEFENTNYSQILDQSKLQDPINNRLILDYKPKIFDASLFFERIFENIDNTIDFVKSVKHTHPVPYYQENFNALTEQLAVSEITGDVERFINSFTSENTRNYEKILKGFRAPSQVVAYRVEKQDLLTGQTLQNFYFFNDQDTQEIEFLDSQVIHKKNYIYRIFAISIVVANEYSYTKLPARTVDYFKTEQKPIYEFSVENQPKLFFMETPYFQKEVVILSKPPLHPEYDILPFFEHPEKVAFAFYPSYGSLKQKPIKILDSDELIINRMIEVQSLDGENVHYSGDSLPTQYQILLLDTEPAEFRDFSKAQVFTTDAYNNSGYIEMNLETNKRFYLVFRAIDSAGISNPIEVYTLVLNSHADGVFVEFNEFEMSEKTLNEPIIFERIIKIEPSSQQAIVNFSNLIEQPNFYNSAPDVDSLSLGISEDKIWAKNYKFRLISKVTGKAIDININYGFQRLQASSLSDFLILLNLPIANNLLISTQSGDSFWASRDTQNLNLNDGTTNTSISSTNTEDTSTDLNLSDDFYDNVSQGSEEARQRAQQQDAAAGIGTGTGGTSGAGGNSSY